MSKPTHAQNMQQPDHIDLVELLKHIIKFWPVLILGLILGAGLLGGKQYMRDYTYTSTSKIYLLSSTTSVTSIADLQIGTAISDDFVVIMKSKPVLDKAAEMVKEKLGVELSRSQVRNAISVVQDEKATRILTVRCTTTDPELSKELCQAVTEAGAERMGDITMSDPPTLVEPAEVAESPNGRGVKNSAVKGGLAGIVLAMILICIPYLLNDKIKKGEDVEKYLGENVLGVVPFDKCLTGTHQSKRKAV